MAQQKFNARFGVTVGDGIDFIDETGTILGGQRISWVQNPVVTTNKPLFDATQTWNGTGVKFDGIRVNITDTSSAADSNLMDLQVGGVSKLLIDKGGNAVLQGNLTVYGTTITLNTATVDVEDKNITLGKVVTPTNTTANGGGITLKGTTDKTIIWDSTNANWTSSESWNLVTGQEYNINNVSVLNSTTLGAGVVNSSLTLVGTLGGTSTWQGQIIGGQWGGTGVNNADKTITLGGNLTTSGAFTTTLTVAANTNVTLPSTGTLSTLAGSETLTSKTMSTGCTWNGNTIANVYLTNSSLTIGTTTISLGGTSTVLAGLTQVNGLALTENVTGFSIAGGATTSKTLTVSNSITLAGTDATTITLPATSGTVPLNNQTMYVGTTALAINRASANQGLTGISSIAMPGATSGTITITPGATGAATAIIIPSTSGTLITSGDTGTVTNTMLAGSIANAKLANSTISGVALGGNLSSATFNNAGSGAASGSTFNGSSALTISYNTVGAAASVHDHASITGTAAVATNATITNDVATNATVYPTWVTATTGDLPQKTSSTKLAFNPSTGVLTTTGLSANELTLAGVFNHNNLCYTETFNFTATSATLPHSILYSFTGGVGYTTRVKVSYSYVNTYGLSTKTYATAEFLVSKNTLNQFSVNQIRSDIAGYYPTTSIGHSIGINTFSVDMIPGILTGTNTGTIVVETTVIYGPLPSVSYTTTPAGTFVESKQLFTLNTLTLSGTDGSTLNVGAGGTLGSAAFTAASAYEVPLTFSTGLVRSTNTIAVAYGTTSTTVCVGNDARLSNTRLTTNAVTFNNAGTGAASGSTFNGSSALTISYNTVGAAASGHDHASITGNAATASTLQTPVNINGVSFNGGSNITVTANTTNALTIGSYLTGTSFNGSTATTIAVDATTAATASKIVARDANGLINVGGINLDTISTNLTSTAITCDVVSTVTTNGTYNITGNTTVARTIISAGITNSGVLTGTTSNSLRNYGSSNDAGTLLALYGFKTAYGHNNADASAPTTTSAYGLHITPYNRSGTITNQYDIYLAVPSAPNSGTVTNPYGIYQANNKPNYFAGAITSAVSVSSPIFYDSNDVNYFVNPAGASNISSVDINGVTKTLGAVFKGYTSVTAAHTLTVTSPEIVLASGTYTIMLPSVATSNRLTFTIKNIGTGTITVDANASETIDGALTVALTTMQSITIICNGTAWFII